ncbi:MAG: hypothetical protein HY716_11640 [Planctomycetes bacterium]|nr:hypothetical protein [Planctomycetota bacterium]
MITRFKSIIAVAPIAVMAAALAAFVVLRSSEAHGEAGLTPENVIALSEILLTIAVLTVYLAIRVDAARSRPPRSFVSSPQGADAAPVTAPGPAFASDPARRGGAEDSRVAAPEMGLFEPEHDEKDARAGVARLLNALRSGYVDEVDAALDALWFALGPDRISDDDNGAPLYAQAFGKIVQPATEETEILDVFEARRDMTPHQRAVLRGYLEKNGEALALIHRAAGRPRCVFPKDFSTNGEADASRVANLVHVISNVLAAEVACRNGPERMEVANVASRVADALAEEITGTAHFGRSMHHFLATELFERAFTETMEEVSLLEAIRISDPESIRRGYGRAALGDLCVLVRAMLKSAASDRPLSRGDFTVEDYVQCVEAISEYGKLIQRPFHAVRDELTAFRSAKMEGAGWYAKLAERTAGYLPGAAATIAETEAILGAKQIAAAVEIHRLRRGSYPTSVEQVGSLLPALPVDPVHGKPYGLRWTDHGFMVTSAGCPGGDDRGLLHVHDAAESVPRGVVIRCFT